MRTAILKHWKKLIGIAAVLSVVAVVFFGIAAERGINVEAEYGFNWSNYAPDIETKYSLAQAQAKFPKFYTWWKAQGFTDAKFMKLSEEVCGHNDAVWRGHTGAFTEICKSRMNVEDPMGRFVIDFPLMVAFAQYHGQGTSAFYSVGATPQGSTEFVLDVAGWQGDPKQKNIFQSNTWGRDDLYSYNESFVIDGYRLVGSKVGEAYDPSYNSSGIAIWDAGSTSEIGRVFAENFNTAGVHLVRGTPSLIRNLTSFRNNLAGIFIEGGGMHHFQHLEFDENPAMIYVRGGHGRGSGAHILVDYIKSETGIHMPDRPVAKYQMVMDAEGWVNAKFNAISYASITNEFGGIPHAMFRLAGNVNSSKLEVSNVQMFGPCYAWLQDANLGRVYPITAPAGLNLNGYWGTPQHGFTFWSDGVFKDDRGVDVQPIACAKNRIMGSPTDPNTGKPADGWPNNAAGTPAYTFGDASPVSPVPTYKFTYTVITTCPDGKWATRSYVSNPAGGVPPADSLSRACIVVPPTGVKWKSPWTSPLVLVRNGTAKDANGKTLDQSWCTPVTATGVTIVEIKGLKCTELNWGRIIGTGGTSGGLQISNTGEWWWANAKMNPQPKKVVKDATADYVITIPSSNIVAAPQTSCGQGGAQIGTIGSITLK